MSILSSFLGFILHMDTYLLAIVQQYGFVSYIFLFFTIFLETGIVLLPFLPGDSMIFTAGAIAAMGSLNIYVLFILFCTAAILGDTLNYWIGNYIGPKVFEKNYKFLNKKYLERTQHFFEKYGGKTIIIARFLPIIRTFAPFLAGVGRMSYVKFLMYNVVGGIIWAGLFVWAGFFFGNVPLVKENFTIVILAIISISLIPVITEFLRYVRERRKNRKNINTDAMKKSIKTVMKK